jgi:hypothetical protein
MFTVLRIRWFALCIQIFQRWFGSQRTIRVPDLAQSKDYPDAANVPDHSACPLMLSLMLPMYWITPHVP